MSAKSLSSTLAPGNVVAGKFRVERVLGKGGMGLIVAATHLQLEKPVALKFFRGDLGVDRDAGERFMREARAAAQLRGEHVARVLDVGVTEDDVPYIVMEFLQGQPLDEIVGERGPLEVETAVEIAIQICEGLAEAHARGIVHRDIKPANLFLVEPSPGWVSAKILDFGISKLDTATPPPGTTAQEIVGTPCYMSPEQLEAGTTVDHRTDLWSLGASLHEILTGTPPFDPDLELNALAKSIRYEPAPPLRTLRRDIPPGLEAVVARCLEKDRAARFESAADLALALLPYAPPRAHVSAERAAAMARGEGLAAEPIAAAPARPAREAPEPPPAGSEAAQRAANRTTNTITSRGIGQSLAAPIDIDDVEDDEPRSSRRAPVAAPVPLAVAFGAASDDAGRAPASTPVLPFPAPDPTPNLRPPVLSKSLAVAAGVVLALVSGSLVIMWLGGRTPPRAPAVVSAPPPAAVTPTPAPTPTPPVAPAPVAAAAPEPPPAAAPTAPKELPKIAIGVPVAATTAKPPHATRAAGQTRRAGAYASAAPIIVRHPSVATRPAAAPPETARAPVQPPRPAPRPLEEVDPAGGRAPQRSILTRNPYESP